MSLIIRHMTLEDIPQVQEIEKEAFPTQWPPPSYKRELQNKLAHYLVLLEENENPSPVQQKSPGNLISGILRHLFPYRDKVSGSLPQKESNIIGMAGIWYMFDEAHVTTVAVRENRRRQGLGELLLIALIDLSQELDARVVTLEVRVSNRTAQQLYLKYGFKGISIRKGYYVEDGEDALIMTTEGITTTQYQGHIQNMKLGHKIKWELDYKETRKF
ncbi:MAG: ribosomal protein S18-alanine N-acetyltransferase [bacterium]|nr:ribosomal protein S18-alanine N-acetyltransferase [bacterium]